MICSKCFLYCRDVESNWSIIKSQGSFVAPGVYCTRMVLLHDQWRYVILKFIILSRVVVSYQIGTAGINRNCVFNCTLTRIVRFECFSPETSGAYSGVNSSSWFLPDVIIQSSWSLADELADIVLVFTRQTVLICMPACVLICRA